MKKTIYYFSLFFVLPAAVFAQGSISPSEIIAKINAGEAVSFKNVRIEGDLDLTELVNKKIQDGHDDEGIWSTRTYVSTVTAPVSFANCTFTGKVLAYKSTEIKKLLSSKNEVYNTNFNSDVVFSACIFEEDAAFKYSEFKGKVIFAASTFRDEALFKYSKFSSAPSFSKSAFAGEAIFKYVKFPAGTSFQSAYFKKDADFKYAEFKQGAEFGSSEFSGLANFKYSKFFQPNFKGVKFNGDEDFKYTTVNGRKVDADGIVAEAR